MFRRGSSAGIALLLVAAALVFVPFAAASNAGRPTQALTVLCLVSALTGMALTWFGLRQHGYVRAMYLGMGALVGAWAPALVLPLVAASDTTATSPLLPRLTLISAMTAAGLWLFAIGLRQTFPRRERGLAAGAIALLMIGLVPAPALLVQPGVTLLNVMDVRQQLRAGFMYWTTGSVLLVAPFLALMTVPGAWFERWWSDATQSVMAISPRRFAQGLVAGAFAMAVVFTWYSFDARPTTADEISQLWHARILLSGRLALPPDPNPEFFAIDNIIDRPHWMSQFPIGGPAVLALGLAARLGWLLNPALTALTALNVYRFVQRAYGEGEARAASVLVALSPMVLLMGATYMNHTPTAFLVTLALAQMPVWTESTGFRGTRRRAAIIIGLSLGAAVTIRPLDGVVAAVVLGLVMLRRAAEERDRATSLLVAAGAGAFPIALLLLVNWRLTGNPVRFGYEVLWGANHSLGLHDDPTGHPHTPWRALLLGVKYAVQLNWIATSWPVPLLLVVAGGMLCARRPHRWDFVLFALFAGQLVMYSFYWHDGQFIGPRFMFTAVPALLILAARAPFVAASRLSGVPRRIALIVIPVCIGVAWLRYMPPFGVQGLAREFRDSRTRLKLDPPSEITSGRVQNALVFVQEGAATRLLRRLWGIGVSRPDAARLLAAADACALLEAVRAEERAPRADSLRRLARIESSVRPYRPASVDLHIPDPSFHVSDDAALTPACREEIALDSRLRNTVAYGPMLLLNRFDDDGHIGGNVVYVINLGERNADLRSRFADRHWFRYEVARASRDTLPALVPYDSAP